jgi:MFS family permease
MRAPGFRRLYLGLAASMFGDSLMLIVLSMWVKELTGSNGAAGLTFLFLTLPALVGPLFGYVVDRLPRRTFLVWANLGSALAVLPLLAVHDRADVWIIYAVAFCYGISFVVVPAALNGLLKDLLNEDLLVEANAALSVTREAFRLVGPLAGASVFALAGGAWVAAADAVTFLVAAVAIGALRVVEHHRDDPAATDEPATQHWRTEVAAGVHHIRRTPTLLHATMSLAICLLVLGFSESAIYAVLEAFDKPVEFVGPILTVQGVGALVSGLLSSRVIRLVGEPKALVAGMLVLASGLAGITLAGSVPVLLVATAVLGAGIPLIIVAYNTLLQKQTPGRLMGRVSTATEVLTTTPQAISIATGALLVTLLDYRVLFAVMGFGALTAAAYLVLLLRGRMAAQGPVSVPPLEPPVAAAATPAPDLPPAPTAAPSRSPSAREPR